MNDHKWRDAAMSIGILLIVMLAVNPGSAAARELVVAIAEFQGPDPMGIPVTETLSSWFSSIGAETGAFRVVRIDRQTETADIAEDALEECGEEVDLLIFGQYDIPSVYVRMVISAAGVSGYEVVQPLNLHLDREGLFSLSELIPGSPPPDRIRYIAYVLTAYVHIQQDDPTEAERYLQMTTALVDSVPPEIAAFGYTLQSTVSLMKDDASSAALFTETAMDLVPESSVHYSQMGAAYELSGATEDALEDYRIAFEMDPDNPEHLYNMSRVYRQIGHYDSAMTCINSAIALDPQEPVYLNSRAFMYNHLQEYESAIEDISMALELDPEYPTGWANLGCAQREEGRIDEAIISFTLAEEFQDDPILDGEYLKDRGYCYALQEDYESAIEDYRESIDLSGGNASRFDYLSWLLAQTGDYLGSRDALNVALEMDPGNPEYLSSRGFYNYKIRELQSAIDDYTAARDLDPVGFRDYEYLGKSYAENGDLALAIVCFTQGAEHSETLEEKAWFISYRGVCHNTAGEIDSMIDDLALSIELYPEEPYFYFVLGEAYWVLDMESEAIPYYDQAIERELGDEYMPWCLFERGRSHFVLENYQAAIADFDATLAHDPAFTDAYYFRGKAHYYLDDNDNCLRDMEHYMQVGNDGELLRNATIFINLLTNE